nr:MAG TPA: hypothetical protein [Caudoviricetes sp.]
MILHPGEAYANFFFSLCSHLRRRFQGSSFSHVVYLCELLLPLLAVLFRTKGASSLGLHCKDIDYSIIYQMLHRLFFGNHE